MAFVKRNVKDRLVQYPRRYQMVEVQPGIFDLIPVQGTITEPGTAINKAYLQPIEDGLEVALEKTGDGKDITVTFTEAATEAHIASGEKLSVMFGKILKKFKSIVPITLGGTGASTAANARTALGVPPTSHASTGTTYGAGDASNYGHLKTRNDLLGTETSGVALTPAMGKALGDSINNKGSITTGQVTYTDSIPANGSITKNIPIGSNKKQGRFIVKGRVLVLFNTDNLEAYLIGSESSAQYMREDGMLMYQTDINPWSGYRIGCTECYISGTNLKLTFKNTETGAYSLNAKISWEVW